MDRSKRRKSAAGKRGAARPLSLAGARRRRSPSGARLEREKRSRRGPTFRQRKRRGTRRLQAPHGGGAPASAALLERIRREGEAAGAAWRSEAPRGTLRELKSHIQQLWTSRLSDVRERSQSLGWPGLWSQSKAFGDGAMSAAGFGGGFAPLPLQGSAAAVLYADASSEPALGAVLAELDRLPLAETIIVAGDVPEGWLSQARRHEQATIACFSERIDPDVGRALGAKLTGADVVLFVDARKPVPAETLARFLWECDGGLDVALNDLSDGKRTFHHRPATARLREFLNVTLNRPDLKMNAIGPLPFALSRNALDKIGPANLAVPAKAHAAAVLRGLSIGTAGRAGEEPAFDAAKEEADRRALAAGDHFEAWREAATARGFRLRFEDRSRDRRAVGGVVCLEIHDHHSDE